MKFIKIKEKLINLAKVESIEPDCEFPKNIDFWISDEKSLAVTCISEEKAKVLFREIQNFIQYDGYEGTNGYGQYGNNFGFQRDCLFDLNLNPNVLHKEA